jgi:hypothetical protein
VSRVAVHVEAVDGEKVSWFGHLARSILTRGVYDYLRLWDTKNKYRPQVVAVNEFGDTYRLFSVASYDEAIAKRDRLRAELDQMPFEAWCDRYVIPATFAGSENR